MKQERIAELQKLATGGRDAEELKECLEEIRKCHEVLRQCAAKFREYEKARINRIMAEICEEVLK